MFGVDIFGSISDECVKNVVAVDLHDPMAAQDANGIIVLGVPAATLRNRHQTHKAFAALQHCALTQVWVV